MAQARAERDPVRRRELVASLQAMAAQDQSEIRLAVESRGARFRASFWVANVLHCELTTDELRAMEAHPRVARVWPNIAHELCDAGVSSAPIDHCVDLGHHNANAAKDPAQVPIKASNAHRIRGKDITIGFFDTGLDLDGNYPGVVRPHLCLRDYYPPPEPAVPTFQRLLGSFLVPGMMIVDCPPNQIQLFAIDCNDVLVHPWTAGKHVDARHGTGVASIALGRLPVSLYDGHAPEANAVCWAISRGLWNQGYCNGMRWLVDSAGYLTGIQMLADWVTLGNGVVDILNISWDGTPDPMAPEQVALDLLATELDILVVTAAGNEGDATGVAHGMHNGLAVGAVRKMAPPIPGKQIVPEGYSSKGPMRGDPDRFYPDICAVGEAVDKPRIDPGQFNPTYITSGTSLAAPQVAGAAALYKARRLGDLRRPWKPSWPCC